MNTHRTQICSVPAMLWGDCNGGIIIAAHGRLSSKDDDCIRILAEEATAKGWQVLSFDFPQHGERAGEAEPLMPGRCVSELRSMYDYAAKRASRISLFGCSMGAYFELLAFADSKIDSAFFLSPVTDMGRLIKGVMSMSGITEDELRRRGEINTEFGDLYFPYYDYVCNSTIVWEHKTEILHSDSDEVSEIAVVREFSKRFGCTLTEYGGGEHWFHTEAQLSFFRSWQEAVLYPIEKR